MSYMLSIRIDPEFSQSKAGKQLEALGFKMTSTTGQPQLTAPEENTALSIEVVSSDATKQTYRLKHLTNEVCLLFIDEGEITPKIHKSAMDLALKAVARQATLDPKNIATTPAVLAEVHNQLNESTQAEGQIVNAQMTPESVVLSLSAQKLVKAREEKKETPGFEAHFNGKSKGIFIKNIETGGVIFDITRLKAALAEVKVKPQQKQFPVEAIIAASMVAEEQKAPPPQQKIIEHQLPTPTSQATLEDKQFHPDDISQDDKANLLSNLALEYQKLHNKIHHHDIQLGLESSIRVQFWRQSGWVMFRVEDDRCDTDPEHQARKQEEFLTWLEACTGFKRDLEATGGNFFNLPTPGPLLDHVLGDRRQRTQNALEADQNRRIPEPKDEAFRILPEAALYLVNAHLESLKSLLGKDLVEKALQNLPLEDMSPLDLAILQELGVIGVYGSRSDIGLSRLAIGQLEVMNLIKRIDKELLLILLKINDKELTKEQEAKFTKLQADYIQIKEETDAIGQTEQDVNFSMTEHQPPITITNQTYDEAVALKAAEDRKWEAAEKIRKAQFEYVKKQRQDLQAKQNDYFLQFQNLLNQVAVNAIPEQAQRDCFARMQANLSARAQPRLMTCMSDALATEVGFKKYKSQPYVSLSWDDLIWNEQSQAYDYVVTLRNHYPKRIDQVIHIRMDDSGSMLDDKAIIKAPNGELVAVNRSMLAIQLAIDGAVKKNAGKEGKRIFDWANFPGSISDAKHEASAIEFIAKNVNGNDPVAVQGMIEAARRNVPKDGVRTTLAEMLAEDARALPEGDDRNHKFFIFSDGLSNSLYPESEPEGPLAAYWEKILPSDLVKIREIQALHAPIKILSAEVQGLLERIRQDRKLEDSLMGELQEKGGQLVALSEVFFVKHQTYQQEFIDAGRMYRLGGNPSDAEASEIHWSIAPLTKKIAKDFDDRKIKHRTAFQYHLKEIGMLFAADSTGPAAMLARQELRAIKDNLGNPNLNSIDTLVDNEQMLLAITRAGDSEAITSVKGKLFIDPTFDSDGLNLITTQRLEKDIEILTNSPEAQTMVIPHAVLKAGSNPFVTAVVQIPDANGDIHRFKQHVPRELIINAKEASAEVRKRNILTEINRELRQSGIDPVRSPAEQFRTSAAMRHARIAMIEPLFRKEEASPRPKKEKLAEYKKIAERYMLAERRLLFKERKAVLKAEETGIKLELNAITTQIQQDEKKQSEMTVDRNALSARITTEQVGTAKDHDVTAGLLKKTESKRVARESEIKDVKSKMEAVKKEKMQLILRQTLNDLLTNEGVSLKTNSKGVTFESKINSSIRAMRKLNRSQLELLKAKLNMDEKQTLANEAKQTYGIEQLEDLLDIANSKGTAIVSDAPQTAAEIQELRELALSAQMQQRMLAFSNTELMHQRFAAIYQLLQMLKGDHSPEAQQEREHLGNLCSWLLREATTEPLDPQSDVAQMAIALRYLIDRSAVVNEFVLSEDVRNNLSQSFVEIRSRYRRRGKQNELPSTHARKNWIETNKLQQGMLHNKDFLAVQQHIDELQTELDRVGALLDGAKTEEKSLQNLSSDDSTLVLQLKKSLSEQESELDKLQVVIATSKAKQKDKERALDDVEKRLNDLEEENPDAVEQLDPRAKQPRFQQQMLRKFAKKVAVAGGFAAATAIAAIEEPESMQPMKKVSSSDSTGESALSMTATAFEQISLPLQFIGMVHSKVLGTFIPLVKDEKSKKLFVDVPQVGLVALVSKISMPYGQTVKHIMTSGPEDFEFINSATGELVPVSPVIMGPTFIASVPSAGIQNGDQLEELRQQLRELQQNQAKTSQVLATHSESLTRVEGEVQSLAVEAEISKTHIEVLEERVDELEETVEQIKERIGKLEEASPKEISDTFKAYAADEKVPMARPALELEAKPASERVATAASERVATPALESASLSGTNASNPVAATPKKSVFQNPQMDLFYQHLQDVFVEFLAITKFVAEKKIPPNTDTAQFAGTVLGKLINLIPLPYMGVVAGVISTGIEEASKAHQISTAQHTTKIFANYHDLIKEFARQMTLNYRGHLQDLSDEGIKTFAECVRKRVIHGMVSIKKKDLEAYLSKTPEERLCFLIVKAIRGKTGKMTNVKLKHRYSDAKKTPTDEGVLCRSALIIGDKVYWRPKNGKNPQDAIKKLEIYWSHSGTEKELEVQELGYVEMTDPDLAKKIVDHARQVDESIEKARSADNSISKPSADRLPAQTGLYSPRYSQFRPAVQQTAAETANAAQKIADKSSNQNIAVDQRLQVNAEVDSDPTFHDSPTYH